MSFRFVAWIVASVLAVVPLAQTATSTTFTLLTMVRLGAVAAAFSTKAPPPTTRQSQAASLSLSAAATTCSRRRIRPTTLTDTTRAAGNRPSPARPFLGGRPVQQQQRRRPTCLSLSAAAEQDYEEESNNNNSNQCDEDDQQRNQGNVQQISNSARTLLQSALTSAAQINEIRDYDDDKETSRYATNNDGYDAGVVNDDTFESLFSSVISRADRVLSDRTLGFSTTTTTTTTNNVREQNYDSNDNEYLQPSYFDGEENEQFNSFLKGQTHSLLSSVISRASQTINAAAAANKNNSPLFPSVSTTAAAAVPPLLTLAQQRAQRTITTTSATSAPADQTTTQSSSNEKVSKSDSNDSTTNSSSSSSSNNDEINALRFCPSPAPAVDILARPADVALNYGQNPTITSTAMAHSLWGYVLRPGIDSAIDATAGNGGDAVALAKFLFPSANVSSTTATAATTGPSSNSKLICIDIQQQACETTRAQLSRVLPPQILQNNIQILHQSHESLLPIATAAAAAASQYGGDDPCIALVVYNLGFLPRSVRKTKAAARSSDGRPQPTQEGTLDVVVVTQTSSTLSSMADAALLLRLGGLLSVMTYPKTNRQEDAAVRAFLTGLALFSSVTDDWREFVQTVDVREDNDNNSNDSAIRSHLSNCMERVFKDGPKNQTWRVHEHKKLGWTDAPILLTATRIK